MQQTIANPAKKPICSVYHCVRLKSQYQCRRHKHNSLMGAKRNFYISAESPAEALSAMRFLCPGDSEGFTCEIYEPAEISTVPIIEHWFLYRRNDFRFGLRRPLKEDWAVANEVVRANDFLMQHGYVWIHAQV